MVKSPKQQARSVSVRKKDKCLVSNGIWLELGFGLQSLGRFKVGDGPVLVVVWRWDRGGQPGRQCLGDAPLPSFTQKGTKAQGRLGT